MSSNMTSQIDDGTIKNLLMKLKSWLLDEIRPLLLYHIFLINLYSPLLQPPFIVYTCFKWKISIIFWLSYFLWTQYDSKTLNAEGRKINCFKHWTILNSLQKYFPLRVIKVADLTPDKNYILACFPHGVIPFGSGASLCLNINNKAGELFPHIDIRLVTLASIFRFPVSRELFMAIGYCTANKKNILNLLNSNPSKAVMIYPGGSREAHFSHPGNVYTIVKNRKGFIRVALETGTTLVPVFSFGEQNILDQEKPKSSILVGISKIFYLLTRQRQPVIKGRGYFQRRFGLFPHSRPVTTVVGKPIEVPKVENPSTQLVDDYHEKFYEALQDLFEKYKHEYDEAGDKAQLIMVSLNKRE